MMFRCLAIASALALTQCAPAPAYDVLIRNGMLLDGTGAPERRADVAVRDGKIVAIGDHLTGDARETIDATGLVVAPGFIDPHTHAPEALERLSGPFLVEQYLTQGVTTIIIGPDGGLAPAALKDMIGLLEARGASTNFACYVGHNGIREAVMGMAQRSPTPAELEAMKRMVREGMGMGCVGLSTGLMYEPGMFSDTAEVIALAKEVKPFDGIYDTHTRDPGFHLYESEREAIEIGRAADIPVKLAHEKATGLINRGKIGEIIELVEGARAQGEAVFADQYPYDGASTRLLKDLIIFPDKAPGAEPGSLSAVQAELAAALAQPARRAAVKAATENGIDGGFSWIKAVGYGNMRIVVSTDDPQLMNQNLELLARSEKKDPFDLVADLILTSRSDIMITLGAIDEADIQKLIVRPWVMIASDGFYSQPGQLTGHPRSTGSFTRVLGHYSRDLNLIGLSEAVRKMTSLSADYHRLYDRGRLAPGFIADVTIFDAGKITDRATYANPGALSEGVVHVMVNGRWVLREGKVTGATPGRFVKRQAPPPTN